MERKPKRILQILAPPQPVWAVSWFGDETEPTGHAVVERVALWALVEFEDEKTAVCGMACEFDFEFCDTTKDFIGYAHTASAEEATEHFSQQIEHQRGKWEKQRAEPTST